MPQSGGGVTADSVWGHALATTLTQVVKWKTVYSSNLKKSSDAEVSGQQTVYTQKKSLTFNPTNGAQLTTVQMTIKFELKRGAVVYYARGKTYKNGAEMGVQRSTSSLTYVEYTENQAGWVITDTVELWGNTENAAGTYYLCNFRIYYDYQMVAWGEPEW